MTEEEVFERHAARVRVGYERIWKPSPEVKRLLELAPTMQDEVFEKCAEVVREILFGGFGVPQGFFYGRSPLEDWGRKLVDKPSTTSPLNTSPELEEDHKEPPEPSDTAVPVR